MEHKKHLKTGVVCWRSCTAFGIDPWGLRNSWDTDPPPQALQDCVLQPGRLRPHVQCGELQISLEEQSYSSVRQQRPAQDAAQRPVGTCHLHGGCCKPRGICRSGNWAFMVLALLKLKLQSLPPYSNARALHLGYMRPPWLSAAQHPATRSTRACCCQLSFEGS